MIPVWVWWTVLGLNVWTFAVYGYDKLCALRQWRRVPERTLLWWTFLCGVVGAWCAMSLFRHKTAKGSFRWRAIVVTVVNPVWWLVGRFFGVW